jgi:ATP-dependent Lon protease
MPGLLIQALRRVQVKDPVLMIDEIDKMSGGGPSGDPTAAMLEVLDPSQNDEFVDHYLNLPFDLSSVLFICTANNLFDIPAPLRDRMEIIRLPGYTEEEKLHIATGYLVPRQLKQHGLMPADRPKAEAEAEATEAAMTAEPRKNAEEVTGESRLVIGDEVLRELIRRYTREAGVRNLEREIGTICRKVARAIAEGKTEKVEVTAELVAEYLGPQRFDYGLAEEEDQIGAATGVSVSEAGGDVLTVEATVIDGKDEDFTLTGQIGKVMEESARAALSYVRAHERDFGIPKGFFEDHAMHIHVPAGAIPKDGPSAGVTMATAIVSALSGRRVRRDVAMTGEITLRGRVLPIGGVKEKLLAAHRAGIKTFILPEKNKKDLIDVPKEVMDTVEIKTVDNIDQVLKIALQPGQPTVTPAQIEAAASAAVVPPPAH